MARIIGAIASSHTPTIGFALDHDKQDDPAWAPIFAAFEPVREWLAQRRPDVLLFIYNDHVTSFFFDHYSAFTLGIGESYAVADEGGGARDLPPVRGHPQLAQYIGASYLPSMTGIATAIYENDAAPAPPAASEAHRRHMGHQLAAHLRKMRGETLEVFRKTRNAPSALYSVAGKDSPPSVDCLPRQGLKPR